MMILLQKETIPDLMIFINKELKFNFRSESVNLWLIERNTGYLYTSDLNGRNIKVMHEEGAFHDCMKN